jgi:hypothetical protein
MLATDFVSTWETDTSDRRPFRNTLREKIFEIIFFSTLRMSNTVSIRLELTLGTSLGGDEPSVGKALGNVVGWILGLASGAVLGKKSLESVVGRTLGICVGGSDEALGNVVG